MSSMHIFPLLDEENAKKDWRPSCTTTQQMVKSILLMKCYNLTVLRLRLDDDHWRHFLIFLILFIWTHTFITAKDLGMTVGKRRNLVIELGEAFCAVER